MSNQIGGDLSPSTPQAVGSSTKTQRRPSLVPQLQRYTSRLSSIEQLPFNVDLQRHDEFTVEKGWKVDKSETSLPAERPGDVEAHGSFSAARGVLRDYRFPPPNLITGIFVPEGPLEQRVMLLRARFLFFTFYFGVRVSAVVDEERGVLDGKERVWGYRYATLDGHFERGEIEFLIIKNLHAGDVRFTISSVSQTATIANIFYRFGFALFGRHLQLRFARESLVRMRSLVETELAQGTKAGAAPPVITATTAEPAAKAEMDQLT